LHKVLRLATRPLGSKLAPPRPTKTRRSSGSFVVRSATLQVRPPRHRSLAMAALPFLAVVASSLARDGHAIPATR
jgi:hypothetical protein